MRRKIIKQGHNSYTLTLPIKWIKEHHLDGGDEIDLNLQDNGILINPGIKKNIKQSVTIDLHDYCTYTIRSILYQNYRKGFDKITLKYHSEKQLKAIKEDTRKNLLGFEVVEEKNNTCIIENITEPSSEKFNIIMRKVFLLIIEEAKEIVQDITHKKYNIAKRNEHKNTIDNFTNYLRRCIIKDKVGGLKDSYLLFHIVSKLSLIHHSYYYLHLFMSKEKRALSSDVLKMLEQTVDYFTLFYNAFYKKDIKMTDKTQHTKTKLFKDSLYPSMLKKKGIDNRALLHIGEIIRLTQVASTVCFGMFSADN